MVAFLRRQRLNLPVASLGGGVIGILVALFFALMPTAMLEDLAIDTGIAAVFAVAAPPLGFTARLVLVFLCGGGIGLIAWFALFVLLGHRSIIVQPAAKEDFAERAPVLRRADAHPDAPARRPLSAIRDLGTPFLEVRALTVENVPLAPEPGAPEAIEKHRFNPSDYAAPSDQTATMPEAQPDERALPADLDQPLAAFDPTAIPEQPADWFPTPAPLAPAPRRQIYGADERFETFELISSARKVPSPVPAAPHRPREDGPRSVDSSASIHALLDRLERGVAKVETVAPAPAPAQPRTESLEDALVTLRRLATRR